MLQDYRYTRPHDPAQCPACAPAGPGHALCSAPGCDGLAVFSAVRHATQAEYDAAPDGHKPIDGVMVKLVLACDDDDHADATASFCTHPEPQAPECAEAHCGAGIGEPCKRADGTERKTPHAARVHQPQVYEKCAHAHREDCAIFTGCQCTGDDAPPKRIPRAPGVRDHADGTGSKLPAAIVQPIVEHWDIPWWTVRSYSTGLTQDGLPMVSVEYAALDNDGNLARDEHGAEVTETKVIALDGSTLPPALTKG